MTSKQRIQTTTDTNAATAGESAERPDGVAQVIGFAVRVVGRVPGRVDLQHAGTPQCQLGLSLGTVLVYLGSHYTAQLIAGAWAGAVPLANSLASNRSSRRSVLTSGPWSVAAMVRLGGTPRVTGGLVPGQPGSEVPTMLRMRVGPVTWDLCDAAAYTTTLAAWRKAAALLVAVDEIGHS